MKKRILPLLLLLLSSCSDQGLYHYYGNMAMPSFSVPYDSLDGRACLNAFDEDDTTTYYCDIEVLKTQEEVDLFFSAPDLSYSEEDYDLYHTLPEGMEYVLLLSQIPDGYLAYKRDNIQYPTEDGEIPISDNFYCRPYRDDISYFFIDLRPFPSARLVQSFLFVIPIEGNENVEADTIRPILSVGKKA